METPYNVEVADKKSFIKFLELFHAEFRKNGHNWENPDLGRFLETMIAYTEDIQGYYDNTNQKIDASVPSWKVFADILIGASMYE